MKYEVYHRTSYTYSEVVSSCQNLACLSPAYFEDQIISEESLKIDPQPDFLNNFTDAFGNRRCYFNIPQEHEKLEIVSKFQVQKLPKNDPMPGLTPLWQEVAFMCQNPSNEHEVLANEFVHPTAYTEVTPKITEYALSSFKNDTTVLEAALDLCNRIFQDFTFDAKATEVESKPQMLIENKRGVCQDFAHFFIACMRAMKIPCKYISGYILTHPPAGKEKLFGVDASHAWVSVFCPMYGWVELDPTNNSIPGYEHIKVAEGRDYHDIPPVKGIFTGNASHELEIAVDVSPVF